MRFDISPEFKAVGRAAKKFIEKIDGANRILRDATIQIGASSDANYGVPAHAMSRPLWVGDSRWTGDVKANDRAELKLQSNPQQVGTKWAWNGKKYDAELTADAGLIEAQAISPWNASWFTELYRQPLLYSHARDLVSRHSGSNPWAEVMSLQTATYSGWSEVKSAGAVGSNAKRNIAVQAGMLTAPVVNIKVFFNYTIEEMMRSENDASNPFAGALMTDKVRYAQYVIDLTTDYLTYYGQADAGIDGLFDVNGVTAWTGGTLASIAAGASTTKGSDMYSLVATALNDFLGAASNKFNTVRIAMSPKAYNLLTSTPYSQNYSAQSPLATFKENYAAGANESAGSVDVKFYADPLLAKDNELNELGQDMMVITSPEVETGAGDAKTSQGLLLQGVPLEEFAYPIAPNGYDTQQCLLRRYAGIFAPVTSCVKVFSGFGE